jgi:hypothetical protein
VNRAQALATVADEIATVMLSLELLFRFAGETATKRDDATTRLAEARRTVLRVREEENA